MIVALSGGAWGAIGAAIGAAGVLAGAALASIGSSVTWNRERAERRREERRAAYEALLMSVQIVAHRLGNLGDEDYGPAATDRQEAAYLFDVEVTPKVRAIQLIVPAGAKVVGAALELREELGRFRDAMTRTDNPPKYRSDAYTAVYDPVVRARDRFIEVAGNELTVP